MDMGNVFIIIAAIFVALVLLSACCRGLRKAMLNDEVTRRRRSWVMAQANRNAQVRPDGRVVRVATIATDRNNENVAYEIYEIHMPSTNQGHMRHQYQGRVNANVARTHNHGRRPRRAPAPEILTPPPPFRTALQESSPVENAYSQSIDLEEPPPTYDDYLKLHSSGENLVTEPADAKGRY